jgi:hypothetical protein
MPGASSRVGGRLRQSRRGRTISQMRAVGWLWALVRGAVPVADLDPFRSLGFEAYDLIDGLAPGAARAAAWNAFVLQTYADKLVTACRTGAFVAAETADAAENIYRLAGVWVARAHELAANPAGAAQATLADPMYHWHTPIRSEGELRGMRETLDALRVQLAFELQRGGTRLPPGLREQLAAVEAKLETADGLFVRRAPAELRGGIGTALALGLDTAFRLGQEIAMAAAADPARELS